ncbi:MAG: response regulator [Deltaproteobacteria bacterium HGW-Deltaproteobacteria-6]|jgi:DNA-binding response OmpR family regulator|nr:MAG: response regulator [Deltaproteobacteria bacterium HGW-Deltaproteobacteria-6]
MRLLIADDDANTINLLRKYLTQWNYDVVTAGNGLEALEIIKGENSPEIIILDWLMPGMDGIEVIRNVRQMKSSSPPYIILFTVRDEKGAIIEGLDAGADDYVTKPFDKDEFHARIRVGERYVRLQNALAQRIKELQDAIAQIHTLRGIIPICSFCHKIRNDQKSWERLEKYIGDHSEAEFSHGICPECAKKHYPGFLEKKID